jgi:hypothetical protein
LHAAYWKYTVWRRLTGEKRGSFPLKGSNWFARPVTATLAAWKDDLSVLDDAHRQLRDVVQCLSPEDLSFKPPGGATTTLAVVTGIAAHDVYHAGQIQLLKRLRRSVGV